MNQNTLDKITEKYENLGENPDAYLEGLVYAKPINYWDYIQVDTLLSLQNTRTDFKDESVFIMYHQITELVLKLMIHEISQICEEEEITEELFIDKLYRLQRYTDMLITSFSVMKDGMSFEDYNQFRMTLTPASGFQSAQFRFLEIYATPLFNLINEKEKEKLPQEPSIETLFEHIYWQSAGLDKKTGKKSHTLKAFEEKYLDEFTRLAYQMKGKTVNEVLLKFESPSEKLITAARDFDNAYNVKWPIVHLRTATHYLEKKGEKKAATGGSEWKKYLHPKFQQRQFFPQLWKDESIMEWHQESD
ncbi:MAG: tryptophan 2,3-dioxygenase family protein [Psychroflexus sp.]|nr:tryptophan 2,3-dioxygenase family protein [Psychroflexus sp.]